MRVGLILSALIAISIWDCDFSDFGGKDDGVPPNDTVPGFRPDRNHGAVLDRWTEISTSTITLYNGTSPFFSNLRQFDKDSLVVHQFFFYPHSVNGVDYSQLHEDSNWYDDKGRLVFQKQYYNPPTYQTRPMNVHFVFRTGSVVDSMIDSLYGNAARTVLLNIFRTRVVSSADGLTDSFFVRSLQNPDFLSDVSVRDPSSNTHKWMSISYDARGGNPDPDTEFVTMKYKDPGFSNPEYEVIVNRSESKNDSIAYKYLKNGRMDSTYIFKSGVLHAGGRVDYRTILDMNEEIRVIYNFPHVFNKSAAGSGKEEVFLPPCHINR